MRVLYLTHTVAWKGGGIFFTAFHQGRWLARRGHVVTLVCISPSSRLKFSDTMVEGVRIVEAPDLLPGLARTGWDIWDTLRRILFLSREQFDIIHGFESRPVVSLPGFFLRRQLGVPLVLTWADWFGRGGRSEERSLPIRLFMAPVEDFCERYFYPRADFLITMGDPLYRRALAMGVPRERLLSLLHGCDTERMSAISRETARLRLGQRLPQSAIIIGYLGYLWSVNADLLFHTLRLVKAATDQPLKLLLIGNHRANLTALLPADLRGDVIETGWVSYEDVNLYLCASDVLVLPLKRTPVSDNIWPSKLNDYFSAGRPVVATSMRILEAVHQRGSFGYLTDDTPTAFAKGILSVINGDPITLQFGRNARTLAEEELSWGAIADRLEALYRRLVESKGDRSRTAESVGVLH